MQFHVSTLSVRMVYRLNDSSIQRVTPDLGSLHRATYPANDMLHYLDLVFQIHTSVTDPSSVVMSNFLTNIIQHAIASIRKGNHAEYFVLRNFLASTLYLLSRHPRPASIKKDLPPYPTFYETTGYFAKDVYRVKFSVYSLYSFSILPMITLLWCSGIFIYCLVKGYVEPNLSSFTEVDFATTSWVNISTLKGAEMNSLWKGISNARTQAIEERIKGKTIFVGAISVPIGEEAIVLETHRRDMNNLRVKKLYSWHQLYY